jgi:hypothetical protein
MKINSRLSSLLVVTFLVSAFNPLVAQNPEASDKDTMLVVVSDSLIHNRAYHNDLDMYHRIKQNFTKVFEKEEWPVDLKF